MSAGVIDHRRHVGKGRAIFERGDPGDTAYVVERGRVAVFLPDPDGDVLLAERGPGELFGEMAIIDDQPRSASARAEEDTTLLAITREQLGQRVERTDPILRMCITAMLDHLRDTLRRLTVAEGGDPGPVLHRRGLGQEARQEALAAILLEQEMQVALDERQFELWYQPIIDLPHGHVAGFEALMRWRHPTRGLVPPGAFIPVAERSGLIVPMGRWAMDTALRDLVLLREAGPRPVDFMSVNFTGHDFADPDFLKDVEEVTARHGTAAEHVKIEITESLLVHSPDTAKRVLAAIRARGTSVAIDDFGTGYSSLSYLQSLPADTLKIDQSFVRVMLDDAQSRNLVRSIVGLGKGLDMKIVAEGVEDLNQARALRQFGVDYGQGYVFARPLPLGEAIRLLETWHPIDLS